MDTENFVTTSFRIPASLKQDIADVAKARRRPQGFIIVEALTHYLECQTPTMPTKEKWKRVAAKAIANGSTKKKAGTR
jgi:predicted transcriptional regulator